MKEKLKTILDKFPYISTLRRQVDEQGAFQAGHYYSPIPSKGDVSQGIKEKRGCDQFPDIDLRQSEQSALIGELADFYPDLPFSEKAGVKTRYYYDQGWFCYSDAIMLYCMIRKFAFNRIVEVGSGYSSAVMLDTMESSNRDDFKITFVEPYPDRLRSLVDVSKDSRLSLLESGVQSIDPSVFLSLEAGDLLFIDSSHVLKYGSDLQFLLFNILPSLSSGVFVHFHDIFYPFEYPSEWLREGRYWNECYFLRAFLSGNRDWKIVLWNHYANQVMSKQIENSMPLCRKNFGGSIYLQKNG